MQRRHTIHRTITYCPILEECRGWSGNKGAHPTYWWEQEMELDLSKEEEEEDDLVDKFLMESDTEGLPETEEVIVPPPARVDRR